MKRLWLLGPLFLLCTSLTWAQEYVKILIETKPSGAKIVHPSKGEIGHTGKAFRFLRQDLPGRVLELQLERNNYQAHDLELSTSEIRDAGNGVYTRPGRAIQLEPNHALVPLKENPLAVVFVLAATVGLGVFLRKNHSAKKALLDREARGTALRDQVKEQHDAIYSKVGKYRILDLLGEGGMAKVFRAIPDDTLDEEKVLALKVLHPHLCKEKEHNERFVREGLVSKDLIHPNIVQLFEIDSDEDLIYLTLELIEGETLREKLKHAPLPFQKMNDYLEQIFAGLGYAHKAGIVHRDLTPRNIMVSEQNDQVKLMDFGLARRREVDKTITATGVIQGTPGYMAPEQLSEEVDARSDQYALGVAIYEMMTGRRPIEKDDAMQQILATFTEDAPDPREFNPDLPECLAEYVLKLLQRNPDHRFPNVEAAHLGWRSAYQKLTSSEPS